MQHSEEVQCVECRQPMRLLLSSCLPDYCKTCFDANVARNEEKMRCQQALEPVAAEPVAPSTPSQVPNPEETECVECRRPMRLLLSSCLPGYCKTCFDANVAKNQEKLRCQQALEPVAVSPSTPPRRPRPLDMELSAEKVPESCDDAELRCGKPAKVSWCTWYQKVCAAVGPAFDGQAIRSRQALQAWKDMGTADQEAWRVSYREFCGEQGIDKAAVAENTCEAGSAPGVADETSTQARMSCICFRVSRFRIPPCHSQLAKSSLIG